MNSFSRIGWLIGGLFAVFVVITVLIYFFFSDRLTLLENIGLIDTPKKTAERLMTACKEGDAEEMKEFFTSDTLSSFYNRYCLENENPLPFEEALDAFAKRQQEKFRDADFEFNEKKSNDEGHRRNSITVEVTVIVPGRERYTFDLDFVRGKDDKWLCDSRL